MRALVVVLLFCLIAGCPQPGTREVDVPDVTPMAVPETGWVITFTGFYSDSDGEQRDLSGTESNCFIRTHSLGAAMDYCGFTAYVGGDSFSLDTHEYWAEGFFGAYRVQIEGSGSLNGSGFHVDGFHPGLALEYEIDYVVTHVNEIDPDVITGFAPDSTRAAFLPVTPELFRPDLFL